MNATVLVLIGVGPLDVGLDTDHEGADLVVVADLAAAGEAAVTVVGEEQRARHRTVENDGLAIAVAPAPAGVDTGIEARPGEDRNRRDDRRSRTDRKVGSGGSGQSGGGQRRCGQEAKKSCSHRLASLVRGVARSSMKQWRVLAMA